MHNFTEWGLSGDITDEFVAYVEKHGSGVAIDCLEIIQSGSNDFSPSSMLSLNALMIEFRIAEARGELSHE